MDPGPQVVTHLFGHEALPITHTLVWSWAVCIVLIVGARMATREMKMVPSGLQNLGEAIVELILGQIEPMMPGHGRRMLPLIGTIFIYIGLSNLVGFLPAVDNPTADLNTTLSLGLLVFVISHYEGMKVKGPLGYIKSFAHPTIILFPLNVVSELAKPISHSFRLFGNMVGGGIIVMLIYQAAPWVLPVPLHAWFDLFVGSVQALIFGMIAIAYIAVARA
ncbi:F0F1 ATP synthase subunit A [Halarsenatibacter silvermanii]|uniref:ATP synthase subunit a n=1 Tax=Halarsenatibacter silvermanii TaxID=321763 RepID=A0A1G9HVR5_9FIRM|nr:F0F1 ATP synthase subunit A [Halarsenatibacter silvermanii]SDL17060.1 ATP synthase F0 subcomplex A subunit [Halarsenatibacter silvermanii]